MDNTPFEKVTGGVGPITACGAAATAEAAAAGAEREGCPLDERPEFIHSGCDDDDDTSERAWLTRPVAIAFA